MSEKLRTPKKKLSEGECADKQQRGKKFADTRADPDERRQLAIRCLLETLPEGVDDKLTMVKAAHHVDKDRFHNAFRSLMRDAKP